METAHTLNAVAAIHPRLSVLPPPPVSPPYPGGKWWLAAGLLLNGALVGIAAVGALSVREQLDLVASRSQQHADAAEQQAQGLKALEARMVDVRRAVSSHAREEALFLKMLILKPGLDPALGRRIAAAVQAQCLLYGQDPNLVLSIIAIESSFNPNAISPSGAVGLMQVMPFWKKTLGVQELTDPEVSIRAGVQVLAHYQQMFRDEERALTAYNRGPGGVEEAMAAKGSGAGPDYSEKVLSTWQRLKDIDVAGRP